MKYDTLKDRAARENILREMAARGLTKSELARIMHKSPQFIWQVVNGIKPVGDDLAIDFAKVFDYDNYLEIYRLQDNMAPIVVTQFWNKILDMHEVSPEYVELSMELIENINALQEKSPELASQLYTQVKSQLNLLKNLNK